MAFCLLIWLLHLMRGFTHKGFFSNYCLHNNKVYRDCAPLWNRGIPTKGDRPKTMDIPSIPTGLLVVSIERARVPVAVAIVHAAYEDTKYVWRGRSDSHWEALHFGWWKGFLSYVIKPLRTTACLLTWGLCERDLRYETCREGLPLHCKESWGHILLEQMCRF